MLETRNYTLPELEEMLGSRGKQAVVRKLDRYDVKFSTEGRGRTTTFDITAVNNPFKVFCILELEFTGQTDFRKLRDFYYCFFNDDEFMSMPDEVKESRMRDMGYTISRQTITGYVEKLTRKDYIVKEYWDYLYYFAFEHQQIMTTKEEYKKAWKEYWDRVKKHDYYSGTAIYCMIEDYGGVARKQAKAEVNSIYLKKIEYLKDLIEASIEKEIMTMFKFNY